MEKQQPQVVTILVNPSQHSHITVTESVIKPALSAVHQADNTESKILTALLQMEEDFLNYYQNWLKQVEQQRLAAEELWHLTQRYMIHKQVDSSCRCPHIYAIEGEEIMINKYHGQYQILLNSNKILIQALSAIRPNLLTFRRACKELNLEEETPFILGDAFHKPIKFFIDLIDELFNYFFSEHLRMDCAAHQLDPLDINSLEYYQKLLIPKEEFEEYLNHNLSYCKCLRLPPKCQERVQTGPLLSKNFELLQAKKARCARNLARMLNEPLNRALPNHEDWQQHQLTLTQQNSAYLMSARHQRRVFAHVREAINPSMNEAVNASNHPAF